MLKKQICAILCAAVVFCFDAAWANELPVDVSGIKAAAVCEQSSGKAVLVHNGDDKLDVGGLSRLPVLLAVCQKIDSGALKLTDTVTVSPGASKVSGPTAFLEAYEQAEVSMLLKAAVVICAGDAICALAEGTYGSEEACVIAVNSLMQQLDIDAVYSDISGSGIKFSACDLAKIGAELMKSEAFCLYSALFYDTIQHADGRQTELASSNRLLKNCTGTNGVGTGSSAEAGYCGVFSVKRGSTGYICVVLGAQNSAKRAEKAAAMIEYSFAAFDAKCLASKGEVIRENVTVKNGIHASVNLTAKEDTMALLPKNAALEEKRDVPEQLTAPLYKNEAVGSITYLLNGEAVGVVELVPEQDVEVAGMADYVKRALKEWLHC